MNDGAAPPSSSRARRPWIELVDVTARPVGRGFAGSLPRARTSGRTN